MHFEYCCLVTEVPKWLVRPSIGHSEPWADSSALQPQSPLKTTAGDWKEIIKLLEDEEQLSFI